MQMHREFRRELSSSPASYKAEFKTVVVLKNNNSHNFSSEYFDAVEGLVVDE